ncbi:MAG: hypothetical protein RR736_23840 [Pseudomonas sp.]|uniref:hypothetical protein n=1 Tax=Pseudomonas sp. TaxID=306 RepID=UPI002FC75E50
MTVKLEFLTQDQQEIDLAKRYWAMDEEGAYLERVGDLLPFREITQPGGVAKYVRQICRAYDENQVCPLCDQVLRINGRTEAKKTFQRSYHPCDDCQERQREEQEKRESAERAELEKQLAPYVAHVRSKTISYSDLTDDVVLILQAIDALIGPRLTQGTFSRIDCNELTPMGADDFIDRLYEQDVLEDDPTAARPEAYFLKDGTVWHKKSMVRYFLPPETSLGAGEEAFRVLLDREFSDAEALSNLWLDYAVTDVMRYLHYQCAVHNQTLEFEAIEKIEGTVRHGLRKYSVAQMWFIMWKVVRDAAALASRTYYNLEKAAATIPTKIRKQLEIADQGTGPRNDWSRPEPHIAGSLGMVFNSLFGLDEFSKGAKVIDLFTRLGDQGRGDAELHDLAAAFMKETLEGQRSLPALEAFAEMVRTGLSTEDALMKTIHRNPEFFR